MCSLLDSQALYFVSKLVWEMCKKIPHLQKHCIHGTRWQGTTSSILFQMSHADIHMTWLSDLCLGQRVKLGNDVMPTIWVQILYKLYPVSESMHTYGKSSWSNYWVIFYNSYLNGLFCLWVQYVDAKWLL